MLRISELNRLLATDVPPIPFSIARTLARYADEILGLQGAYEQQDYSGDIGLHFMLSSSLGHKGRLIATIIRLMPTQLPRVRHMLRDGQYVYPFNA
jgi:hypothetical protein